MKNPFLLIPVLILLFASCTHFYAPHYRHVRKVDAHCVAITPEQKTKEIIVAPSISDSSSSKRSSVQVTSDTLIENHFDLVVKPLSEPTVSSSDRTATKLTHRLKQRLRNIRQHTLPRDWTLLISIVFVLLGITVLFYAAGVLFAAPLLVVLRWIFSALLTAVAIKLIVRGVSMFVNHFRSPQLYKEKG
jgi:hypothetical protein